MIVYHTEFDGQHHELGTSGFLYRSNKLMYDKATSSMWSTLEGQPVIGPLVGKGIKLKSNTVVTSDWGTWRKSHPNTKVVSLEKVEEEYTRDYSEGAAYRDYFANDTIMYQVPKTDERLKNKASVLTLRFEDVDLRKTKPIAFESKFLEENPVHHHQYAGIDLVIVTDSSGAHRVYNAGDNKFASVKDDKTVVDESGVEWKVTTDELVGPDGKKLARLPSHNVFWFGWYSQFPDTDLIMREK